MFKKNVFKTLAFIVIFILMVSYLNSIFIIKTGHRAKLIEGIYKSASTEFDVILLGSSHMNSSINPNVLWENHGITSFNYGTGGQPLDVTYYLLKEILKYKTNNPIVVLDVYYIGLTSEFGQEGYIRYVLDNMKFSKNKIDAILKTTPKNHHLTYLFPLFKYHSRWKELTIEDFFFDTSHSFLSKGFAAGDEIYGKNISPIAYSEERMPLPSKTNEYIYKFIELSKKKGFQLIFINAPHDYSSTSKLDYWHKEPEKIINSLKDIAKDNDIPFVNYNELFSEIGFDFKRDMFNEGHLNIWGSNKVSKHFGEFLKTNYDLVNHRKDRAYSHWMN